MDNVIKFEITKKNVPEQLANLPVETANQPRLWQSLALELYANGYTAGLFKNMEEREKRVLLVKALPSSRRIFYLAVLADDKSLYGKSSFYGFRPPCDAVFSQYEVNLWKHKICSETKVWAGNVFKNLKAIEAKQLELPAQLRKELQTHERNREIETTDIQLQPTPLCVADVAVVKLNIGEGLRLLLNQLDERRRKIICTMYEIGEPRTMKGFARLSYNATARLTGYSVAQVKLSHQKFLRWGRHPCRRKDFIALASMVNPSGTLKTGEELLLCDMYNLR